MKRLGAAVGLLLIAAATPASAERLIVSVSRHQVRVNSSFDGTQIVLFGSVERDAQDRKSTRLNSSHMSESRMPSSA